MAPEQSSKGGKETISRSKSRSFGRDSRTSLSPSTFQNLSLSSRTPPSHAVLPSSQQGSPVMTSAYLSQTTTEASQSQQHQPHFHMMAARIAANSPCQFETEFVAEPCYGSFYENCSSATNQLTANEADHFRYEVTPFPTNYDQACYGFPSRSDLLEYGSGNLPMYSGQSYDDGVPVTMAQCSEAMDPGTASLASSRPYDSSDLSLQQLHFHPGHSHFSTGSSISRARFHQSPHAHLRQSSLLTNPITADTCSRTVSPNPSLSSNIPHSLASQYPSTLSSVPVVPSTQSDESLFPAQTTRSPHRFFNTSSYHVRSLHWNRYPSPRRELQDENHNAGTTDVMAENSPPLATSSDISERRQVLQQSLNVPTVGPFSREPRHETAILRKGSVRLNDKWRRSREAWVLQAEATTEFCLNGGCLLSFYACLRHLRSPGIMRPFPGVFILFRFKHLPKSALSFISV
ncbi:conserved hypothetical protein [Uncinocarpus reesii 1704]|uniref:Uncharacterized protein n=1 Tax=Uncinocarpus reesii (strain UAMH 1704) TaxID=336963 RepID=C4JFH5_UNCRE|nr:uncharacterized protein UREG_00989 [Uncinocarpus reesii 1704]EEP76140.1 conserved hypothetical protein [Uncinocarpus reesii 1704]